LTTNTFSSSLIDPSNWAAPQPRYGRNVYGPDSSLNQVAPLGV